MTSSPKKVTKIFIKLLDKDWFFAYNEQAV